MSLLYNTALVFDVCFLKKPILQYLQLFHVALKKHLPLLGKMSAKTEAALTAVSLLTLYAQEPGFVTDASAAASSAGGKVGTPSYKSQMSFLFSGGGEGTSRTVSSTLYPKAYY